MVSNCLWSLGLVMNENRKGTTMTVAPTAKNRRRITDNHQLGVRRVLVRRGVFAMGDELSVSVVPKKLLRHRWFACHRLPRRYSRQDCFISFVSFGIAQSNL